MLSFGLGWWSVGYLHHILCLVSSDLIRFICALYELGLMNTVQLYNIHCTVLGMAVDREALLVLRSRRFDSSSSSAVVSTFGVTSTSLSGTTTLSVSYCSAASTVAVKLLVLTALWLVTVYTLCRGAANIGNVIDVPAVFVTNVNLVYIMSWVFLQRQFVSIRVCSLCENHSFREILWLYALLTRLWKIVVMQIKSSVLRPKRELLASRSQADIQSIKTRLSWTQCHQRIRGSAQINGAEVNLMNSVKITI